MADQEIILFHYAESIFSHRVVWFLQLRGIGYRSCIQPPYLPRPDLERLGIAYRRIPILAIGRDVYCDSREIIRALEERIPASTVKPQTLEQRGIQHLLENYSIEGGVFWRAASLLPVWKSAFLQDPKFIADRSELIGQIWDSDALIKGRAQALAQMRVVFDAMESSLLADGRNWILGTDGPTVADIDTVFPLQWMFRDPVMEGSVPEKFISAKLFPKTFAWIDRFLAAVAKADSEVPEPEVIRGPAAIDLMLAAEHLDVSAIDPADPSGLKLGDRVTVNPVDHGSAHLDEGSLSRLSTTGVSIINDKGLQLHFPRWNFNVKKAGIIVAVPSPPQRQDMRYIYHPMSPYSRKCYMLALELGLEDRLQLEQVVVAPVAYKGWSDNNNEVAVFNPLAKIPTLVPEAHEDGIYDSRTICDYLLEQAASPKPNDGIDTVKRWRLKTLHACADGLLDAQVLLVYENKIRAEEGVKLEKWVVGQTEKITRCLDRLETEAARETLSQRSEGEIATAAEVAVAAALGFLDILKTDWRPRRPYLGRWFEAWEQRASFLRTRPAIDWKTGKDKALGFANEAIAGQKKS